jgi:hypothetical protein
MMRVPGWVRIIAGISGERSWSIVPAKRSKSSLTHPDSPVTIVTH